MTLPKRPAALPAKGVNGKHDAKPLRTVRTTSLSPPPRPRPGARARTPKDLTRPARQYVDLSKLRKTSLKRYKKHFNLDVKADSKTELLEAVGRHFAAMPVREADVALEFHNFARSLRAKRNALGQDAAVASGTAVDAAAAAAAAGK